MSRTDEWVDPLKRLIKDHSEVSEHLENLEELLGILLEEEGWTNIKRIEDFFERSVISHFEFEEKKIFPPILLESPTLESVKLILELQREHGIILKELEEFRKIVSENTIPLDEETNKRLNVAGRTIRDNLLRHSLKEDKELLPILEKNRQIFDKL
ncbi:MAG TPA: hemerythrin domain-containing protein [Nitrospinota bacterium]|nr:hemerythrin domain-containing protein [Nitrospinota bacterium]